MKVENVNTLLLSLNGFLTLLWIREARIAEDVYGARITPIMLSKAKPLLIFLLKHSRLGDSGGGPAETKARNRKSEIVRTYVHTYVRT